MKSKFVLVLFVLSLFIASCASSGHSNQPWQPHHSSKGGRAYK
jgi:hypothetical protein